MNGNTINVTPEAVDYLRTLLPQDGTACVIRLTVDQGGNFGMSLETLTETEDHVEDHGGLTFIMSRYAQPELEGGTLTFNNEFGEYLSFHVSGPSQRSGCCGGGCGCGG